MNKKSPLSTSPTAPATGSDSHSPSLAVSYKPGQKVQLKILRETDLGFVASINNEHEGLLYHSEVFEKLESGQELPGYIKLVRPDGKIDLILQAFGNFGTDELSQQILQVLEEAGGFLPITDKTPPEEIYNQFGVSKKKFKMALGSLYKRRLIEISEKGFKQIPKAKK